MRLPRGAGVIHRGFGRPGAEEVALALAAVARRRGLVLLIGADAAMARRVRAHGVHLPERSGRLAARLKARRPGWVVTTAAHGGRALARAAASGADAALVSPVFPSRSPSAGGPLTPVRFARLVRDARLPVVALGGVTGAAGRRIGRSGAAGLAAADAFVRT